MNYNQDNDIHGVYKLQRRWELFWIIDVKTNQEETIKEDKLRGILLQSFNFDLISKLFDELYNGDRFLVDFDSKKIKRIKQNKKDYQSYLYDYFKPEFIQNEINEGFDPFEIYKKEEDGWLN